MNLLIDTNILIDYLGCRPPFYADAERIIASGFFNDASLWMAAQAPKDAFYVLSKYTDSISIQKALLKIYNLIKPISLSENDLREAARLAWQDYEDCLIFIAAQKAKADYIITRDVSGFLDSRVPALTPKQWLSKMKEQGITYDSIDLVD